MAHEHDELRTPPPALARSRQQCRIGVGEVTLERVVVLLALGPTRETRRLGLGPGHDRGPDVGLEREIYMHHRELVTVAPGTPGAVLPAPEIAVLL
ncbi:MAG: hypothetical protein M3214_14165, partial [Actinomycetota bacterium]|nr:hypothetical protein [Actinomycetota bacterium]